MIEIGDRVRSYDFPFNDDCYIEGVVVSIEPWEHCSCDQPHVSILVDVDTFEERNLVGEMVYPVAPSSNAVGFFPPNGLPSRIEIVAKVA